jgi:hypothetical protein
MVSLAPSKNFFPPNLVFSQSLSCADLGGCGPAPLTTLLWAPFIYFGFFTSHWSFQLLHAPTSSITTQVCLLSWI